MPNIAVRVENLGKMYRIGGPQEKYVTLRDTISSIASAPYRKVRGLLRGESASGLNEEIWALRDVSFEIKHGEVVGIVGRNGAGKSTLLKILSRITEPTAGYADIYGRVGALLEVGTGFHPELTGRENVFLNGAILGMSRIDIERKFDEIVEFSGVEKFIDTPVKHYSSGMGLRLGFAVAAHLEPEILIVDEVLAVGDAEFQRKCLGKMGDVANEGRTVLFVSHNMAAVQNLCHRGIILEAGIKHLDAEVGTVIENYISKSVVHGLSANLVEANRIGGKDGYFSRVELRKSGFVNENPRTGDDIDVDVYIRSRISASSVAVCLVIWDSRGSRIIDANTSMKGKFVTLESDTDYHIMFRLKNVLLREAVYKMELWMGIENQKPIDYLPIALTFEVLPQLEATRGTVDYPGSYRCDFEVSLNNEDSVIGLK